MLYETIKADMKAARKERDTEKLSILSTLAGDLGSNAKIVDGEKVVSDEAVVALTKKFIKNLDEMLERNPGDVKSLQEKTIIEKYLPREYSEEELRMLIGSVIASGADNIGKIMGYLKQNHAGKYNGKIASDIAKEELTKV